MDNWLYCCLFPGKLDIMTYLVSSSLWKYGGVVYILQTRDISIDHMELTFISSRSLNNQNKHKNSTGSIHIRQCIARENMMLRIARTTSLTALSKSRTTRRYAVVKSNEKFDVTWLSNLSRVKAKLMGIKHVFSVSYAFRTYPGHQKIP